MPRKLMQFVHEARKRRQHLVQTSLYWLVVLSGLAFVLVRLHMHGQLNVAGILGALGLSH